MKFFNPQPQVELDTRSKILLSAQRLFARQGYDGTTTKELAIDAGIAEGTLFRYFANKKAILIEVATQGWVQILTDLLTELSEMGSYKAIAQMMRRRMGNMQENLDMMKVCFMEAQFHPELRDQIQSEVIGKMTDIAEVYFEEAIGKGIYRSSLNPKVIARVFVGMFAVAGFSNETMTTGGSPFELQQMAEGVADIFLNGVLVNKS
ncbi:TetR/AcrR family transcriptional regulator [Tumidithrix helvetica PCC 7403]|uniref:TetR/AcrR family transcriptional regulator n=1 Tax=Tumidithrix helvetica TaxID=3457545 RepID=UPI003C8A0A48